jgi:SAM-dependent methyltransferase
MTDEPRDAKLLAAIPQDARSVLEFGCGDGRLGAAGKAARSGLRWTGIDPGSAATLGAAASRIDAVVSMDFEAPDAGHLAGDYDTVVCDGVLEQLRNPHELLRFARTVSAPDARLVCRVSNVAHVSVIERMLAGDLSCDPGGARLSPATAFKLLLDCGWLPQVRDRALIGHPNGTFLAHLVHAARELGIPEQTVLGNIASHELIVDAVKWSPPAAAERPAPFSVVVPVNNRPQFELNVLRSPGLAEVLAPVIPVEGARNPAEALQIGVSRCTTPWIVFCHQDVYFARGTGEALGGLFGTIAPAAARSELIGFAGVGELMNGTVASAGLVIDRSARFDHPPSAAGVSIDELAVAVAADSVHSIDPSLGWHLWATDLCLAARARGIAAPRIVRIPLFHNSYNDGQLPPAFYTAAGQLRAKYPQLTSIPTLCGVIGPPAATEANV